MYMTYICTIPGQKSWMLHLYRGTTLCHLRAYVISIPVKERTYDLVLIYFLKKKVFVDRIYVRFVLSNINVLLTFCTKSTIPACYCPVHVYVVIHYCDCMWSF